MVKQKQESWFNIALFAFLLVFLLFIAVQVIRKLLGGSWDAEPIILAFITANFVMTAGLMHNIGKTTSDFHKSLAGMGAEVRRDISRLEGKICGLENKVGEVQIKIRSMEKDVARIDNRLSRIEIKMK